jgi:hypothetical protein
MDAGNVADYGREIALQVQTQRQEIWNNKDGVRALPDQRVNGFA